MKNGEQITFKVNPGENFFGVIGLQPWSMGESHHEIMINCEPNKTYYLLTQMHCNIAPTIERVSKFTAKPKLQQNSQNF